MKPLKRVIANSPIFHEEFLEAYRKIIESR